MNRLEKLGAVVGLSVATLALSGCAETNQVNGTNLVDCKNGPKTGELTTNLLIGSRMQIGGTGSGLGNEDSVYVSFEKGTGIGIEGYRGLKVIEFPLSAPQLEQSEVGIDKEGVIFMRSRGIDFRIKASDVNPSGATVNIKAVCEPSTP